MWHLLFQKNYLTKMSVIHSGVSVGRQSCYVFSGSKYIVLVTWKLSKWSQTVLTSLLQLALILASLFCKSYVNEAVEWRWDLQDLKRLETVKLVLLTVEEIISQSTGLQHLLVHVNSEEWHKILHKCCYTQNLLLCKCKDETHIISKDK